MKTKAWSRLWAVLLAGLLCLAQPLVAQVLLSANGYEWDLYTSDGSVSDGGDDAFDGYGELGLRVMDQSLVMLGEDESLGGFNVIADGRTFYSSVTPQFNGINITRTIYAPADQNYLRYFDTFTNATAAPLVLTAVFGGNLGSDSSTTLSRTSSGDATLNMADHWAITIENDLLNPAGPAENDPVVGVLFGNTAAFQAITTQYGDNSVFTDTWIPYTGTPPNLYGDDGLSYRYFFTLAPGQTAALVYFLYRGQAEVNTGSPLSTLGGYGDGPLGTGQIDLAATVLNNLSSNPDYAGLSALQIGQIINFTPVPEPSTWVLLLSGVAVVMIYLRRRQA